MRLLELYIHIPFCKKKCKYCDFLSGPSTADERESYVKSLCQDIRSYAHLAKACRVISIFVGGGTPSTLTAFQMQQIFSAVRDTFVVEENAEITVEMNPGTVDREKLSGYKKCGINRLSIGLQSTKNRELQILGRIHFFEEFLETYHMARAEGFENINVDLMSAIPGQSLTDWEENLKTVAELAPEHISAYSLIVEEGTPFARMAERGELQLPEEDTERAMYEETREILAKYGFLRYEISNYARDGYECLHNVGYWIRRDYLGFGIGAASLVDNVRFQNGRDLITYLENPQDCREEEQVLTEQEQMEETMFLGLRLIRGISYEQFEKQYGRSLPEVYGPVITQNIADGLLREYTEESGERFLALTEKGLDVSNYVMAQFLF